MGLVSWWLVVAVVFVGLVVHMTAGLGVGVGLCCLACGFWCMGFGGCCVLLRWWTVYGCGLDLVFVMRIVDLWVGC